MDEDEIVDHILDSGRYDIEIYNGATSQELKGLTSGTEYYAVAFGVEGMYPTTAATIVPFYTTCLLWSMKYQVLMCIIL